VSTLAAAATHHHASLGLVALGVIVVTACYLTACAVWPFRPCRHCAGAGKARSPTGRAFHHCRHCGGSGAQLRTGRRLYTALTRTRGRANRDRPRPTNPPWRKP
jgi:hypothetical protein